MESQKVHILVVDDDPFVREMLSMILESGDYTVETAESGDDALEKYSKNPDINLIVSDMNMPGKNGIELIRDLRKLQAEVPIIILTGNNEISVATEAMNNGASDCLPKDENIQDTILLSVKRVLGKKNLENSTAG